MLLVLGQKLKLTKEDKKVINSKFQKTVELSLQNNTTDDIINEIEKIKSQDNLNYLVLNLDRNIPVTLESYLEELDYNGVSILAYSDFSKKFLNKLHIEFNDKNFKVLQDIEHKTIQKLSKRSFDILFSFCALVGLFPVFLIVGLIIKIKSPGAPVVFGHRRIGKDGRFFRVYKFRSMVPNAEKILEEWLETHPDIKAEYEKDFKLKEDPRIIPGIGHFIRKSSIDELPQFFNSFIGDMSVVGPRPIVEKEVEKYGKYAIKLYSVKPGVTGLWQVSGRNDIDYDERVALDMEYIDNQSFLGDLKIVFLTVLTMIFKKGAY